MRTAPWTTRSVIVGILTQRDRPSAFGMYLCRSAAGLYSPVLSWQRMSWMNWSQPFASMSRMLTPSMPAVRAPLPEQTIANDSFRISGDVMKLKTSSKQRLGSALAHEYNFASISVRQPAEVWE